VKAGSTPERLSGNRASRFQFQRPQIVESGDLEPKIGTNYAELRLPKQISSDLIDDETFTESAS